MAKSIVISLTNLVTVSGTVNLRQADTTTAALYLRRFDDAGTYAEEITGTGLGNGDWQFDCPEGNYQLWKSAYPDATAGNRIDKWHGGAAKYRRIQDEVDAKYFQKDGSVQATGQFNLGNFTITSLGDATEATHALNRQTGDARYVLQSTNKRYLLATNNVLIVDYDLAADVAGYRYNTIQEAIDYAAGVATSSSRWTVYVVPHKNNSSYSGYSESITLKKYVDLIGLGMVLVKGPVAVSGTWTGGTFARITNFVWVLDDTSFLARGVECYNVHFLVFEDISTPTIATENSQFVSCGFWQRGIAVTTLITSTGDNKFINCVSNKDITSLIGSDKQVGFDWIDDNATYYLIT